MERRLSALTWGGLDDMHKDRWILSNPYSDVWLNVQKSAEAIVPCKGDVPERWEYERSGKG
jgi:hypothetical protein